MRRFRVRFWDPKIAKCEFGVFSYKTIIHEAEKWQLNMGDVGLILLNIERQNHGLELFKAEHVSDNDGTFGVEVFE